MGMYVSGYDSDTGEAIWADDGEASVSIPVDYRNTEPDMYGESASSGSGSIADRAARTEAIAGDLIYTMPDGSRYGQTPDGAYYVITDTQYNAMNAAINNGDTSGLTPETMASLRGQPVAPTGQSSVDKIVGSLKGYFTDAKGNTDWAKLATAAAGIKAVTGGDKVQTAGWQGKIPMDVQAIRGKIDYNDPNRRPGSMGRQYFTDTAYASPSNVEAAKAGVTQQAQGILAGYTPTPARVAPTAPVAPTETLPPSGIAAASPLPLIKDHNINFPQEATNMATGGIAQPRYLQGASDGMADKIPSSIDGKQKASLSHGEFVIPADVVSHFGNGNSDAGAQKLYDMMSRIRKARTGNSEQGKRINPDKFMPGGQVGYAAGGIARFDGESGSAVTGSTGTTGTSAASTTIPNLGKSTENTLSSWAGPYVADYLGKGAALSNTPYQAYTGPLTAGASDLQTQSFGNAGNLNVPTGQMGAYTPETFNTTQANKYMNPYLSSALNPVLEEQRRQAEIDRVSNAGRLTQQGAYGGGRQAIMESEGLRNLQTLQNKTLTEGYKTAYDKAMDQFNKEQGFGLQSQTANNVYGFDALGRQAALGATQRDIEQQGITADKTQFEEQRDNPYKMVQYQKDLLQGLPIATAASTANQTQISQIAGQIQGLMGLYQSLAGLGQTK
jgi:hypothetical protein